MALPTPETVPFRLTRDLVDGMGIAGVEGVFRRCCEETMRVMRASHEELRTIVEVSDALTWCIGSSKKTCCCNSPTHRFSFMILYTYGS